ncbi:MAG: hypothetical protein PHH77_11390 [Victivallaceae bacterium]|nr:hypothetical protein [Victivallaceae bacterium]
MSKSKTHVVTVVSDFELYEKCVKSNPYLKDCVLTAYDNSREAISIVQRYNDFIENHLRKISPHDWIIFCNQEFGFLEDFKELLNTLAPNSIYGIMGAEIKRKFSWRRFRFCDKLFKIGKVFDDPGQAPPPRFRRQRKLKQVETLDSCCMMVNAELLQDFSLSFNEKLPFYFYVEEFCLAAFYKYKIKSYVLPLNAFYACPREFPPEYFESRDYLKAEYHLRNFASYGTVELHPTRYSLDNMVETVVETVVGIYRN